MCRFMRSSRLQLLVVLVVSVLMSAEAKPEKVGAGLLLCCNGKVLLLKRNSKHNDKTWGLPGGNVEATDDSLLGTAIREASEEFGVVPPFETKAQIFTRRGKQKQKHYTVFVADVQPTVQQQHVPQLNHEHTEWRWVPWNEVIAGQLDLHPVMRKLLEHNAAQVQNLLDGCSHQAG
eukprot:GHRR01010947.1.p1 GENE.GHRR01010947.1~~GHRR01010947.1.p1  ORF type:complete len:176 (+),score=60.36 GHRR01010947.1:118-645(+)